jgi:hypothetical protein
MYFVHITELLKKITQGHRIYSIMNAFPAYRLGEYSDLIFSVQKHCKKIKEVFLN